MAIAQALVAKIGHFHPAAIRRRAFRFLNGAGKYPGMEALYRTFLPSLEGYLSADGNLFQRRKSIEKVGGITALRQ